MIDPRNVPIEHITRRRFFRMSTAGIGAAALGSLLSRKASGDEIAPHFAPKAKHLIYLFMNGGASQMDLYDYKPKMQEMFDKDLPPSIINGQRLTTMTSGQSRFPVAPSKFAFKQHGQSGAWISELLPNIAKHADKISFIKSVHTEAINHDPAVTYICTGAQIPGKASLGSWLSYGLGSENENLPSFIVMTPSWSAKREAQALYNRLWGSGFLPTRYQGVWFRLKGDPVLYLSDPPGVDRESRRRMLEAVIRMNTREFDLDGDPETQGRIAQYEMAFKMQQSVPELVDFSKEPKHIRDLYGPDLDKPGTFAQSAILARRMIERGVRQVQIFHREWDHHGSLPTDLGHQCRDVDQPIAGLLTDLEQRGLLDETLVVWGSEFGRTAYCQGKLTRNDYGRDHHPRAFVHWFAGAGIKPGLTHGETDDFSYNIVKDPVHIRDINATILHLMGMDHKRLIYKYQGLDQRLTGVEEEAKVVKAILASIIPGMPGYQALFAEFDPPFEQVDNSLLGPEFPAELDLVSRLWFRCGYRPGVGAYLNFFLLRDFITTHDTAYPPRFKTFKAMATSFYRTDLFIRDVTDSGVQPTGGISSSKVRGMLAQIQQRHRKIGIPPWMQTYFGFSLLENVEKQCAPMTDDEKRLHLAYMAKTYRIMGMPFSQDRARMEQFSRQIEEEQAAVTENVPRHSVNILRMGEMIGVSSKADSILPMLPPKTRTIFEPLYPAVRPGAIRRGWCRILGRLLMPKAVGSPRKAVPVSG